MSENATYYTANVFLVLKVEGKCQDGRVRSTSHVSYIHTIWCSCCISCPWKLNQSGSQTVLRLSSPSLTFGTVAKRPQLARGAQNQSVTSEKQKDTDN